MQASGFYHISDEVFNIMHDFDDKNYTYFVLMLILQ